LLTTSYHDAFNVDDDVWQHTH